MREIPIRLLDLRGRSLTKSQYQRELPRAEMDVNAAVIAIEPILRRVQTGTESDLLDLCEQFDGVRPQQIRVPEPLIFQALTQLAPEIRAALEEAIRRITKVHREQIRDETITEVVPGGVVTQRWIPVDRVGLYVPGGRAVYPSSVIMNVDRKSTRLNSSHPRLSRMPSSA